jgi:predicted DNA-binding transcriptional regulator YafY
VTRAGRLRRLLQIVTLATARPGIQVPEIARALGVSTRTVFRDFAELDRLGLTLQFNDGYEVQPQLFQTTRPLLVSQLVADLIDRELAIVKSKLRPQEHERVLLEVSRALPAEATRTIAAAVEKGLARRARK